MNLSTLAERFAQAQPARMHVALPLAMMAAIYWISSLPGALTPDAGAPGGILAWIPPWVQNLLHVPVYAALAWAWRWALGAWLAASTALPVTACAITAAYGLFDEWHQSWVPGRFASTTDVVLDFAGAFLGVWLAARVMVHVNHPPATEPHGTTGSRAHAADRDDKHGAERK